MQLLRAFCLSWCLLPLLGAQSLTDSPATFDTEVVTGTCGPRFFISLAVESPGITEAYGVRDGQQVSEGEVVLRLKREEERSRLKLAESMVSEAEMMVAFTKKNYERARQMHAEAVVSEQELDSREMEMERARAKLVQAKGQLDLTQASLDKKVLRAPVDGLWFRSLKEPGEAVQQFESIGLLTDPTQLEVTFLCPPSWEGLFELDQRVPIEVVPWQGGAPEKAEATVSQVDPLVDPAMMRFRLTLSLDPGTARSSQLIRLHRPKR